MPEFAIGDTDFLLDGRPFRILSGALHYFRVHPDLWADRIDKARRMGLNTIETYVAWNAHAPEPGTFDLTGGLDLDRFLRLVAEAGMYAIVRPGPYICAEWDNGGLPAWLFRDPSVGVRRYEPKYLDAVRDYLSKVYEVVVPHQIDRGGPVLLVQVENEYGAFGDDKRYLKALAEHTRASGITVPLTTVDQPTPEMLAAGSLDGLHRTASFGSGAEARLAILREHQPTGPLMCSEFWNGWFDHWGAHHHTTAAADSAAELDVLLAAGASVNLYMFHGGTNFGLTNGANDKGRYLPIVTSYDYDAPLDERGDPTEKYFAFREVIAKYAPVPDEVPVASGPAPEFAVAVEPVEVGVEAAATAGHVEPPTFEQLGQLSALVAYEADLGGRGGVLRFGEVRDHAWVSVDAMPVGTLSRTRHEDALVVPAGQRLRVLVEEQGRVNYDVRLGEAKGLIAPVTLDGVALTGWTATPIDVAAVVRAAEGAVPGGAVSAVGPFVRRGTFSLDEPEDLFLDTAGWGKGFAAVNGFVLGRYWSNGPQRTLYVPAAALVAGENTLVILELDRVADPVVRFVAGPSLGHHEE
jgi:beta-galactosidase